MSHKKRTTSRAIRIAATRAAGLEAIAPNLDLGSGITLEAYRAAIEDTLLKQTSYNALLAQSDEAGNVFESAESNLRDLSGRVLAAVAAKYGRDSNEYEKAGGIRTSDRKRPVRKAVKLIEPIAKAA